MRLVIDGYSGALQVLILLGCFQLCRAVGGPIVDSVGKLIGSAYAWF